MGNSLLLPVLFGIFGFILGALLAVLLSGRGKPEPEEAERAPAQAQRRPGEVRVWHEGALSRLVTEMDGQAYTSAKDLSNEQRQRLVRMLRDWASWLEVAPPQKSQPGPAAPLASPPAAAPVPPKPQTAPLARPVAPPPSSDGKAATQASIVAQINVIMQEMPESATVRAKGIRLVEDARNGVTVWVGLQHFDSIDSVSDPEALALIRAAVAEWERRAEGKGV